MKRALIWDLMYEIDPDLEDEYDLSALEDWLCGTSGPWSTRGDYGGPRRPNQKDGTRVEPARGGGRGRAARRRRGGRLEAAVVSAPV